jgi:hypothetical protein
VCVTKEDGEVSWLCSDVLDPAASPEFAQNLFGFFEQAIVAHPGRWWASHLLQDYPVQSLKEAAHD